MVNFASEDCQGATQETDSESGRVCRARRPF